MGVGVDRAGLDVPEGGLTAPPDYVVSDTLDRSHCQRDTITRFDVAVPDFDVLGFHEKQLLSPIVIDPSLGFSDGLSIAAILGLTWAIDVAADSDGFDRVAFVCLGHCCRLLGHAGYICERRATL